jgi:hypothetical protein
MHLQFVESESTFACEYTLAGARSESAHAACLLFKSIVIPRSIVAIITARGQPASAAPIGIVHQILARHPLKLIRRENGQGPKTLNINGRHGDRSKRYTRLSRGEKHRRG